jgi:hypothetical protein
MPLPSGGGVLSVGRGDRAVARDDRRRVIMGVTGPGATGSAPWPGGLHLLLVTPYACIAGRPPAREGFV